MKKEDIRNYQLKQIVLLDEIDRVCKKLHLTYYLIAGTLLGAVRHGGFIPWDVDLDIAMPRNDYQKLKEYYLTNPSEDFFYEDYDTEKYHNSTHALLRLKGTRVIRKRLAHIDNKIKHNGFFLDIFPLDKAPNDEKLQEKQIRDLKRIKKIFYYKEGQFFENASKFKNTMRKIISFCLKIISYKYLGKKLEKIQIKYNSFESDFLVSMSSRYSYQKQKMPKEIYGVPGRIKFENKEYNSPQEVEKYLSKLYNDYMKLPPIESRYDGIEEFTFVDERTL